jgi:hypothetical protein
VTVLFLGSAEGIAAAFMQAGGRCFRGLAHPAQPVLAITPQNRMIPPLNCDVAVDPFLFLAVASVGAASFAFFFSAKGAEFRLGWRAPRVGIAAAARNQEIQISEWKKWSEQVDLPALSLSKGTTGLLVPNQEQPIP